MSNRNVGSSSAMEKEWDTRRWVEEEASKAVILLPESQRHVPGELVEGEEQGNDDDDDEEQAGGRYEEAEEGIILVQKKRNGVNEDVFSWRKLMLHMGCVC